MLSLPSSSWNLTTKLARDLDTSDRIELVSLIKWVRIKWVRKQAWISSSISASARGSELDGLLVVSRFEAIEKGINIEESIGLSSPLLEIWVFRLR